MSHKLVKPFASLFLMLVVATASFFPVLASPPTNDNFDSAEVISSLPFSATVDVVEATMESGEPNYSCLYVSNTVWYSFTTSQTMNVKVDTQGSTTFGGVAVFRASGPGFWGLSLIGCTSFEPSFFFTTEPGQTYYFQVGSGDQFAGTIQFNLAEIPPPPNDDFENSTSIPGLPFEETADTTAASTQNGEPSPNCSFNSIRKSVWYAYTSVSGESISASIRGASFYTIMAVYTGNSLDSLNQLKCIDYGYGLMSIQTSPGTTYFFQVGGTGPMFNGGPMQFILDVPPLPDAAFYHYWPNDPSIFDTIGFENYSSDPAGIGIQTNEWDFGDGSTSNDALPTHQYAADGDYLVTLKVTTYDGRTASAELIVRVRTQDVAVSNILLPMSAKAGQTSEILVQLKSEYNSESVKVVLYKSIPGWPQWEEVNTLIQEVPVSLGNRLTMFSFEYTFTEKDAQIGKVVFKAEAVLEAGDLFPRNIFPQDNSGISSAVRIDR